MPTHARTHKHTHTCTRTRTHTHTCTHTRTCTRTHAHSHAGNLREESLAINKSLFTLRQVVLALSANASAPALNGKATLGATVGEWAP